MGGREGEGRVSRRGGDKVGNHAESEEPTQGGTRCWGGGKGILRKKNQHNQDGDGSRVMLPEKSNQGRTGRSPKKVSLDTPRKCEPMSEGNLSATLHRKWPLFPGGKDKKTKSAQPPPSLPAEKEKEKDNGPPAKNRMAEGRQFGRSLGAVGGSGRGGYPGRGEGGMEGGYGEGGRLGERGGFMRPPGGGSRGLSSGAQIQSGREGFGRGAGRGGGPRGAGSSQSAGRREEHMGDPAKGPEMLGWGEKPGKGQRGRGGGRGGRRGGDVGGETRGGRGNRERSGAQKGRKTRGSEPQLAGNKE
jgi:hypothetical protein